jgi:hypothetical protein
MADERKGETSHTELPNGEAPSACSAVVADLSEAQRRRLARRFLVTAIPFVPLIVASVLTTKAVAATKVIITSIPTSL